jgi:hypothetical protein
MTDISITAANVIAGTGARRILGTAGATIIAGKVVYLDDSVSKYKLADNNSVTAALRSPAGIALNGASDGQPLIVHEAGPLTIGATLEPGAIYLLSDTPGGICPVADLTPGEYPTILGIATSTTVLQVDIQESGVAFS